MFPCRSRSHQVGVALLTGKTGAPPPADGAEPMAYEKEAVTTEGGLEATVEVRNGERRG